MEAKKQNKDNLIALICVGTTILALFGFAFNANDDQHTNMHLLAMPEDQRAKMHKTLTEEANERDRERGISTPQRPNRGGLRRKGIKELLAAANPHKRDGLDTLHAAAEQQRQKEKRRIRKRRDAYEDGCDSKSAEKTEWLLSQHRGYEKYVRAGVTYGAKIKNFDEYIAFEASGLTQRQWMQKRKEEEHEDEMQHRVQTWLHNPEREMNISRDLFDPSKGTDQGSNKAQYGDE